MTQELIRTTLIHGLKLSGDPTKDIDFLKQIDATGGWPIGYKFVSFFHADPPDDRFCKFGNTYLRLPFWTTVLSADDYYWWKLSGERKFIVYAEARKQLIKQLK
jgi:hypothetical protein